MLLIGVGCFPMLNNLGDAVRECLRRAEACHRQAKTALNAHAIEHFLKMEQRWLFLAQSRQFAERIQRFLQAQPRRKKEG